MMRNARTAALALAASTAVAAATGATAVKATAAGPAPPWPIGGHAMFTVFSWGKLSPRATAASLPTWTGSFPLKGFTYTYQMVGTNPASGSATTTIPTEILPLKVVMANGVVLNGSQLAGDLKASPILSKAVFTSGKTQLADAMQRAEFWKIVSKSAPNWHVLLAAPKVLRTVTIKVPAADGTGFTSHGIPYANIEDLWWTAKLQKIITAHSFSAKTLPLILSGSTFLYLGDPSACCIYGFHGSYNATDGVGTYAFSDWIAKGLVSNGVADVYTVSHEVSEWANDPYVSNVVPEWDQPNGSTCFSGYLEVGDPVEALPKPWYAIKAGSATFHPSDIAGVSWFAHTKPSTEQNGHYSYKGYLSAPSKLC
jgi:hypothetical protein